MRPKAYAPLLWAAVLALLIAACGTGAEPPARTSRQTSSQPTASAERSATQVPPTVPAAAAGSGIQLILQTSTKVWLRVVADGEQVFEGQLEEGAQMTWGAEESLLLRTSNAGGVQVSVNGQPFMRLGPFGKALEREYRLKDGQVTSSDLK